MNLQISSKELNNPLLVDLLRTLVKCFNELSLSFYVIGATARDILLRKLLNIAADRKTQDLDIAIAIENWERYDEVSEKLQVAGLKKSTEQKQRFYYQQVFELDVVPFGGVETADGLIYWQPEQEIAMSVKGFKTALNETITVTIDEDLKIQIVSLQGLFLLKLSAWNERHISINKDADDIALILENYLEINQQRAVDDYFDEIYETDSFDIFASGAILLGKDIKYLFNNDLSALSGFVEILQSELDKKEESRLTMQILETHKSLKYEQVFRALQNIYKELIMR